MGRAPSIPCEPLASLSDSTNPPSPERYPVVIIDDDPDVRILQMRVLQRHGYAVTAVASAEEALPLVAKLEAPILVCDKNLPGMDGLDLIEALRAQRHDFESVLVTAYADVHALLRSVRLGVFRCVLKPFHTEELAVAVAGAANRLWLRLDLRARKLELEAQNDKLAEKIRELERAERRRVLGERLESLGRLAAGVAHEINTPLGVVVANLDLLQGEIGSLRAQVGAPTPDADAMLRDAMEGAERVRTIVRDLRALSRADDEAVGPIDLCEVVERSLGMAKAELRHRATVVRELGKAPLIAANVARLGQVVVNLLLNAAQAIPEGHAANNVIRVVTRAEGERAILEVHDTGCGIAPDVLAHIFDPFFTTKPIGEGTGLGLAICHGIVRSLGGSIDVESRVGVGSCFRVTLPGVRGIAPTAPAPLPRTAPHDARSERANVLAIDDDVLLLGTLKRVLGVGHDVDVTSSARDALARLESGTRYDVIVCDLMMPDMTGMDFHAALRARHPELAERVIFLTGGAFTEGARSFLDAVPNRRLEKPFDGRALSALIREQSLAAWR